MSLSLNQIIVALSVTYKPFMECHYAECRYAECHYAECGYAECRNTEYRYAECCYAECRCAEYHYAECHYAELYYAECHYAECRGTKERGFQLYERMGDRKGSDDEINYLKISDNNKNIIPANKITSGIFHSIIKIL